MRTVLTSFIATCRTERGRVIFAGISALILTVGLARFAYTPMLPIMRNEAGLSALDGGWLATINYAGYMSGTLITAAISRLEWKFHLYRLGLVVALLSTVAMGLTDSFMLWAFLRFISGVSSTGGLLLASGLVLNWLIRQGQRPELGVHFMGIGLGIVVSGLGVAALVDWLSWDQQWLGLGVIGLAFFVPAWRWMPAPAVAPAGAPDKTSAAKATAAPGKRWMWLMIAVYFCGGFGFVVSATFIVAILVELPLLAGKGSWVWVIVGLAAAPSTFVWDRIARTLGQIQALMLAYALQAVAIVLPAFTASALLNIGGALLFGATFVGIVSLTLTLVGRHFPTNPAKAMARMTLSYGVAQIVAPAMTGYIVASTGSYDGALIVTTLIVGVGLVLLRVLLHEERQARAATPPQV